jgi:putative ABC transport system permease protein
MQEFQFQTGKYSKTLSFKNSSQATIIYGRNFTSSDNDSLSKVAIVSKDTADEISKNPKDVLGYGLPVNGELYEVIGIADNTTTGLFFGGR